MDKPDLFRGTGILMISQMVFVLSGYLIHIGLARLLGPSEYGIYAVVISLMTMFNLILSNGMPQTVSKYVAHADGNEREIKNTALKLQLIFSLIIFSIYFLLAGQIAELLNDRELTWYIRISAFIVPAYAVNILLSGYLNGLKEYKKQAISGIAYSVSKVLFILSMVYIGYAVTGAITGFVLAPLVSILVSLLFIRMLEGQNVPPKEGYGTAQKEKELEATLIKKIMDFAIPVVLFSMTTNLIMNIDLFFVKAYLTNFEVGVYSAAATISKIPYFLISGLYGALFPVISHSTSRNNVKNTRGYISQALKISLLILIPLITFIVLFSEEVLSLVYSDEYIGGETVLGLLVFGLGLYSLYFLFATILNGSGKPRISMTISILMLIICTVLNLLLVPEYGMEGAAIATAITCFMGCIIGGVCVYRSFYVREE